MRENTAPWTMRSLAVLTVACVQMSLSCPSAAQVTTTVRFTPQSGEAVYKNICQGCHMPNAMGAVGAGAYPRLAENPKLGVAAYPVLMVMNGRGAMPAFADSLDDAQVANVINYVRSHFGNSFADRVTPADVAAVRPRVTAKELPRREHR